MPPFPPIQSAVQKLFRSRVVSCVLCGALSLCLLGGLAGTSWIKRQAQDGLPGELPPLNPQMVVPQLGVNAELGQYSGQELDQVLEQIHQVGFFWVRQTFPWAKIEPRPGEFDWTPWDQIVRAVHRQGLQLIAVLDTSPVWARQDQGEDAHTPPREITDFGRFARAFAARYGDRIDYYQIWDEPNLSYHWGGKSVDAGAYTHLLREGAVQIRAEDPQAWILTAGLAPAVESGPLNVNAPDYLEKMYAAGGAPFFDILAVKGYGFQYDAWDRRLEPGLLNFSRVQLVRQVMERREDMATPVWAVEFGWNHLPEDWTGSPSPWGNVGAEEQLRYTLGALARAEQEWPWMGAMMLMIWQPNAPPEDPIWGFALVDSEGCPRPLLRHLEEMAPAELVAHVGRYPPHHPTGNYEGHWQVTPEGADIGANGDRLIIRFYGTRLDLTVHKSNYWALLYVAIDGKATTTLPRADDGRSYVVLYSPEPCSVEVPLARYLPDGYHTAEIVADRGWGQWAIRGWSVYREADTRLYDVLQVVITLALLIAVGATTYCAWSFPWPRWLAAILHTCGTILPRVSQPLTLVAALAFYLASNLPLSLLCLMVLFLSLFSAPSTGLPVVALAAPFYRQPKQIAGKAFSMAEIMVLMVLASWAARQVMEWLAELRKGHGLSLHAPIRVMLGWWRHRRLILLDGGMIILCLVSLTSIVVAQEKRVALREFRTVIIEPLIFYLLIRIGLQRRKYLWRILDGWALGGLLVAVWGLYQFLSGQGTITTMGVQRVKGPYGSPNNLALMLGRQLPLLVAVGAFGRSRWRRLAYALALIPAVAAFGLTYSRAGWLIGLPGPLLFLGIVRGGEVLLVTVGALIIGGLSVASILGIERFQSLLNPYHDTLFFRLKLWQSSLAMIRDHPLLGVGLDNFLYQYRSRYILPSAWQEPNLSHPHNLVLEFWTRTGVLGVSAMIWLEMLFFRQAWSLYKRLPEGDKRALVLGVMGGMVNVLSHGLVDNGFFVADLAYVFCLMMGAIAQLRTERAREN